MLGVLVGLPSRRLVGDYLAIVTLFFGQAFVIFVNNANRIDFPFFGHNNLTGGSAGIDGIDALHFFGWTADTTRELYFISLGDLRPRDHGVVPRQHVADRPRVARAARGLARGRGDVDPGPAAEADGVRLRRRRGGPGRLHLRVRADRRLSGRLRRRPA